MWSSNCANNAFYFKVNHNIISAECEMHLKQLDQFLPVVIIGFYNALPVVAMGKIGGEISNAPSFPKWVCEVRLRASINFLGKLLHIIWFSEFILTHSFS